MSPDRTSASTRGEPSRQSPVRRRQLSGIDIIIGEANRPPHLHVDPAHEGFDNRVVASRRLIDHPLKR